MYVSDVADAFEAALDSTYCGDAVDIGASVATSVTDVVRMTMKILGAPVASISDSSSRDESGEAASGGVADTSISMTELGWTPKYDLMTGLRHTVESHMAGSVAVKKWGR